SSVLIVSPRPNVGAFARQSRVGPLSASHRAAMPGASCASTRPRLRLRRASITELGQAAVPTCIERHMLSKTTMPACLPHLALGIRVGIGPGGTTTTGRKNDREPQAGQFREVRFELRE